MGSNRHTNSRTPAAGDPPSDWAYVVITPRVVSEGIDGEILAIDNETGTYFNIEGAGVEIWLALISGATRDSVVEAVMARYTVGSAEASSDIDLFVSQIANLGVLTPMPRGTTSDTDRVDCDRVAYRPPVLSVYTDLQDLLLFDPIHEVVEAGWPHQSA